MELQKLDKTNLLLGLAATGVQLTAYAIYNWQILIGASKPNIATWGLWTITSTMNCLSYFFMNKDIGKIILPAVSTLATFATFSYALLGGGFSSLNEYDSSIFFLSLFAAAVWWYFRRFTLIHLELGLPLFGRQRCPQA